MFAGDVRAGLGRQRNWPGRLKSGYFNDDTSRSDPQETLSRLCEYLVEYSLHFEAGPMLPKQDDIVWSNIDLTVASSSIFWDDIRTRVSSLLIINQPAVPESAS
jgi:hypothetical protein